MDHTPVLDILQSSSGGQVIKRVESLAEPGQISHPLEKDSRLFSTHRRLVAQKSAKRGIPSNISDKGKQYVESQKITAGLRLLIFGVHPQQTE